MHYERVRIPKRTIKLKVISENETFLQGVEVDKFGDEVAAKGCDEHVHIIDKTVITKRTPLLMNPYYAELEEYV